MPDDTAPSVKNEVQDAVTPNPVKEASQATQGTKNAPQEEISEESSGSEMEHESGGDTDATYVTDESNFAW